MRKIEDPTLWHEAWGETPFGVPRSAKSPEEAMTIPGCYVVSRERDQGRDPKGHWPRYWARVVKFNKEENHVVVRSSEVADLMGQPRTVWVGTVDQFYAMWKCD